MGGRLLGNKDIICMYITEMKDALNHLTKKRSDCGVEMHYSKYTLDRAFLSEYSVPACSPMM